MLRNKIYYRIKPLVPWVVRVAVRRMFALRRRTRCQSTWPVMPGSEQPPRDWPGWPDGKKFALVLTHDVEGQAGVDKCEQLMDLERHLGFRSCFSFIPRGSYHLSRALRSELTSNGFEIGVHDLHHDGKLYQTRETFVEKAARINQYLKDWGAVGFRSAFMLHNLHWLHDLNVRYDCSTFDTDPFEPQPDGVGTIFPFWVPRPNGKDSALRTPDSALGGSRFNVQSSEYNVQRSTSAPGPSPVINSSDHGYVELPYTLPQDSTLFLLLQERTPDIWLQKLDWVAKHGGMALMDVHPDYMRFNGDATSNRTFPADFYAQLLEYVRKRYGDSFWHPLPKELAAFTARFKVPPRHIPKRVCMVAYSNYVVDARVMRYAETLASRGDHVDVLGLRRSPDHPKQETIAKVNVVRIQDRFGKNEKSKLSFLLPLVRFLFVSSAWLARQHTRKRYDLIHVHNPPDFLVLAALYPRLTGARVILDIHDILPEFYGSKFGARDGSVPMAMLKLVERVSASLAGRVIISNHLWIDKYAARTGANGKCSVVINHVDAGLFRPQPRIRTDDRFVVLFPGGLQWHQGLDIAIRAFQKVSAEFPKVEFRIYGDGNMKEKLVALTRELGLDANVRFFDPQPAREIARIMAEVDLGVVPKRADSFGNEAYSTKIMEFMAVGVPVVVSNTSIDRYYFDDTVVRFFESGNPDALAEGVLELLHDPDRRRQMVARGFDYAARNSWQAHKDHYLRLVDSLVSPLPSGGRLLAEESDNRPIAVSPALAAFNLQPKLGALAGTLPSNPCRGVHIVKEPTFVLVTPARNEAASIEITIRSVLAQTLPPKEWIIVSDGSTDLTDQVVRKYSRANSCIRLLRLDNRPARNFASVVFATETGYKAIQTLDYAFLGLVDADVRFQPDYFEKLLEHFASDPSLGLAGGLVLDVINGQVVRERQSLQEVAGAVHFFRRECFESLRGLVAIPEGGWDSITAIQARANGYTTRTFPDLVVEHLKPRNISQGGPLRRRRQMGVRDYAVGNHPLWEIVKCAGRTFDPPVVVGAAVRLVGFAWCLLSRRQRMLPPDLVKFVQREQLDRLFRIRPGSHYQPVTVSPALAALDPRPISSALVNSTPPPGAEGQGEAGNPSSPVYQPSTLHYQPTGENPELVDAAD